MQTVRLMCIDGRTFDVDLQALLFFRAISMRIIQNVRHVIHVPYFRSAILKKTILWAEHHKNDALLGEKDEDDEAGGVSIWDRDFLKMDQATLDELLEAAQFLEIKELECAIRLTLKNVNPQRCL